MIQLDRHIRNTVVAATLIVLGIIITVDIIFSLVDELGDVDQAYTAGNALLFVVMTTPTSIYEMLPFAALGGTIFGLGVLASHNELIVMQSAGIRVSRIIYAVLKPTAVIMLLSLILGQYVSPPLEQLANSNKAVQTSGSESISTEQGTWRKVGDEYFHINAIAPGGRSLIGLSRYRVDENRRILATSFAESAQYIEEGEPYWQLINVRVSNFEGNRITTNDYLQEDWVVDLSPELLSVILVEPDKQSISGLYRLANFFQQEGLEAADYFLAFWKKLLQPVATLALVILAISFVFGPLRETTMGFRVLISLTLGLGYTILQRMLEPLSLIYGFSPIAAVAAPILLCIAVGVILLRRVR